MAIIPQQTFFVYKICFVVHTSFQLMFATIMRKRFKESLS